MEHFKKYMYHVRDNEGRFIVLLPWKANITPLGESRIQAIHKFKSVERSLRAKGIDQDFAEVMREYFNLGHAEQVPLDKVDSPATEV